MYVVPKPGFEERWSSSVFSCLLQFAREAGVLLAVRPRRRRVRVRVTGLGVSEGDGCILADFVTPESTIIGPAERIAASWRCDRSADYCRFIGDWDGVRLRVDEVHPALRSSEEAPRYPFAGPPRPRLSEERDLLELGVLVSFGPEQRVGEVVRFGLATDVDRALMVLGPLFPERVEILKSDMTRKEIEDTEAAAVRLGGTELRGFGEVEIEGRQLRPFIRVRLLSSALASASWAIGDVRVASQLRPNG